MIATCFIANLQCGRYGQGSQMSEEAFKKLPKVQRAEAVKALISPSLGESTKEWITDALVKEGWLDPVDANTSAVS